MPYADPEKRREADRRWRVANPGKQKEYYRRFRDKPGQIEKDRAKSKRKYRENLEKESERKAVAYEENKPRFLARNKKWKKANPEKLRAMQRKARAADISGARSKGRKDQKRRRLIPSNKIADSVRKRIWSVLKGNTKCSSSSKLLGCSFESFKVYLESKFEPGMNWGNYGTFWEIDHIMPCAIFDLTKPEHQKRCFHFSNHQPLTVFENRSKHSKVLTEQLPLL